MKWREWKVQLTWWHKVTLVFTVATPLVYLAMMYGIVIPMARRGAANPTNISFDALGRLVRITIGTEIAMLVMLFVWVSIVSAWLDAGNPRFSDLVSPVMRSRHLSFNAWIPFFLALFVGIVPLAESLGDWLLNKKWEPHFILSWWLAIPIVLLAAHGWWFGRLLQRRLRTTVSRARLCYQCGYRLAEIPNCTRCPECGTEVAA